MKNTDKWHQPTDKHWNMAFNGLHVSSNVDPFKTVTTCVDDEHPTEFMATYAKARKPGHVVITLTPMSGNKPQTNFRKWQVWPFCPKDSGMRLVRRKEAA